MLQKKKIVFVSHDASRTGAPILLLNFIAWLKQREPFECFILLLDDGPLLPDFEKLGKVFLWSCYKDLVLQSNHTSSYILEKTLNVKIKRFKRKINQEIRFFQPELVYVNTVASCKFISNHRELFSGFRLVLHIHEMPFSIKKYIPDLSEHTFKIFSGIIVVNSIIEKFVLSAGVESTRILKVPEYLNQIEPVRTNWGNAGRIFTVLGVGLAGWRKGTDLFVQTAYQFSRLYKAPFIFKWVGDISPELKAQLMYDVMLMGIENNLVFTGVAQEMEPHFINSDVFFLSSREDPYPLVMLEAARHRKPIVYFSGTGGADEFIGKLGLSAAAFDTTQAASAIHEISATYSLALARSEDLFQDVRRHSLERVGPEILGFIYQ